MKTKQNTQSELTWLIVSIVVHSMLLAALFVTLRNKPTLLNQPQKRKIAFKVPAPVVFFGHQMDPHKKPGSTVSSQTNPMDKAQPELQKQKIEKKQITPEKKIPHAVPKKKTVEPTLADIFNHARKTFSSTPESDMQSPGDGAGQPVVIKEGDMKYYSLWSTFLKHLNNAAKFNRVQRPVPLEEWIRSKKITKNMQCAITINKKGEVMDIEITSSSGYKPFDTVCVQDIWSASPFPPLPDQLGRSTARFEVTSYL